MEGAGGPPGPVVEISSGQIALVENNWNLPFMQSFSVRPHSTRQLVSEQVRVQST